MKFFLLGDWGAETESQRQLATQMSGLLLQHQKSSSDSPSSRFESVIALGDNFYEFGLTEAKSEKWMTTWKNVYSKELRSIPWCVVLGNHDYYSGHENSKLQIRRYYDHKDDDSWFLPDVNYTISYTVPAEGGGGGGLREESNKNQRDIHFVHIDTPLLVPSSETSDLDIPTRNKLRDSQLHWINGTLFRYRHQTGRGRHPPFIIVVGHYPIYSIGEHGNSAELISYLEPLLIKYNVSLYIAAHDHVSAYIRKGTVDYIVAGSGSQPKSAVLTSDMHRIDGQPASNLKNTKHNYEVLWYKDNCAAFSVLDVNREGVGTTFIDGSGEVIFASKNIPYSSSSDSFRFSDSNGSNKGNEGKGNKFTGKDVYSEQYHLIAMSVILIILLLILLLKKNTLT